MLIQLVSDLHLEFYNNTEYYPDIGIPENSKDIILILAGDIGMGCSAVDWIKGISEHYRHVIYIAGNHEFYNQDYVNHLQKLKDIFSKTDITFLDKTYCIIDDILIFGSIFWTPGGTALQDHSVMYNMSDFSRISIGSGWLSEPFTPDFMRQEFKNTIKSLNSLIDSKRWELRKIVVVSHHAPSEKSSLDIYKGNNLNPYFYFNVEDWLDDSNLDEIDLWLHGHMHNSSDYHLDCGIRVVANPYGYPKSEEILDYQPGLVLEI